LFFSLLKNTKNSSVAMAMQRFFEFFRRKNYGALWNNLFNFFHLSSETKISLLFDGFFFRYFSLQKSLRSVGYVRFL